MSGREQQRVMHEEHFILFYINCMSVTKNVKGLSCILHFACVPPHIALLNSYERFFQLKWTFAASLTRLFSLLL